MKPMPGPLIIAALLLTAGLVGCSDESDEVLRTFEATPSAVTPIRGPPPEDSTQAPSDSALTPSQVQTATTLAFANEDLIALLDGAPYELSATIPWYLKTDELVGAVVLLALEPPLAVDADLPGIDIGVRGEEGNETRIDLPYPGYVEVTQHYQLDARTIHVFLDLREETVVEIFPIPFPLDPEDITFE